MKSLLFGASLLLAVGAAIAVPFVGDNGSQSLAQDKMGGDAPAKAAEGEDDGDDDNDAAENIALLHRMVGRWDLTMKMGDMEMKATAVREMIKDNMLIETMSHAGQDGSPTKTISHYMVDMGTGEMSFTSVCDDGCTLMYGSTAGMDDDEEGEADEAATDDREELVFSMLGCTFSNKVRVELGVKTVVDKDGNVSKHPWEKYTMIMAGVGADGAATETVVATGRASLTVIPDVPDVAAMMAAGTPGEPHKRLATYAGEWTSTFAMTPKGMPPMEFPGTASCEMVMGGRFLREKVSYDMGDWGKQDMELLHGFNNTTGKYELTLFSSDSTNIMTLQGEEDEKTKVITFDGKYYDFTVKDYIGWRAIVSPVKDGKSTTKLLANYGNEWTEMGVITYTKAPAPAGK